LGQAEASKLEKDVLETVELIEMISLQDDLERSITDGFSVGKLAFLKAANHH